MFELGIKTSFSAAHHLVAYPGACAVLHGHNWAIEIFVKGDELDELGMLLDFKVLKASVNSLMEELDHTDLNTHEAFHNVNPTSEFISQFLYKRLSADVNTGRYKISKVTVYETPTSQCSYWEQND